MKLAELSDIRKGVKLDARILVNTKPSKGLHYAYLEAENFTNGTIGKFVAEKELKRLGIYSNRIFLNYGDYLIYKQNEEFKIFRYTQNSGQTIPSETLIVISSNYSIVSGFLGYEKNKKYCFQAIEKWLSENTGNLLEAVGSIEIMTDDILELENSDTADQYGIRKPLESNDLPIKITQKPIPLDKLIKRIEHGELILDTEFQRKSGLWKLETKSRFIESLIVSVPIPAFYFDGADDGKWLIIDGLQRLSTVSDFLKGDFELTALDYLEDLKGKKFADLDRPYQRNIEEYEVFAYILQKGTPQSVKYKIFKNINTSALILKPQEIRHAINPQKPSNFLKKIVYLEWFKKYVPIGDAAKDRMYDRETVLRFIAFQRKPFKNYSPTIVEFLDDAMYDIYDIPEHGLSDYEKDLEDILNTLFTVFGEPCFSRNIINDTSTYTHNSIIFELLTYGLSKLRFSEREKLTINKEQVKITIVNFFKNQNDRFWDIDYANSQEGLRNRFEGIELLMNELKII
jgi:Protein of unknown function DUF262